MKLTSYHYKCSQCGAPDEVLCFPDDQPEELVCMKCGAAASRVFGLRNLRFKPYVTDELVSGTPIRVGSFAEEMAWERKTGKARFK